MDSIWRGTYQVTLQTYMYMIGGLNSRWNREYNNENGHARLNSKIYNNALISKTPLGKVTFYFSSTSYL